MTGIENLCPECRTVLNLTHRGDFDTWVCPQGHGVGVVLTEAWGHLQDDELHAIWAAAKKGTPSTLKSPGFGQPMVDIVITADDDETEGNEGTNARSVSLSVDVNEQFLWFAGDSLSTMPGDLPNPQPTAEELSKVKEIADEFGKEIYEEHIKESHEGAFGPLNAIADRFADHEMAINGIARVVHSITPKDAWDAPSAP